MASSISFSETILASPSTIKIASFDPATNSSSSDFSNSSLVGLRTNLPSILPTFAYPIGPLKGTSEMAKQAAAPRPARTSGSPCGVIEITWAMMTVSFMKPSGKSGRRGLSIKRMIRISAFEGRPSLFIKPPRNFPAA